MFVFLLSQENGVNAWSCTSGFCKDLGAGAALAEYLRNDERDGDGVLDLGVGARLLEDLLQEEERLKGTRNCPNGYGRVDFTRKHGELAVNRVLLSD
jgi:hypothetical protein